MANHELYGVGGWLKFLVFAMMFLAPVFGGIATFSEMSQAESMNPELVGLPLWGQLKAVAWITFGISAAIYIVAGHRLNTRFMPESVRFAIGALWLAGPVMTLLGIFAVGIVGDFDVFSGGDGAKSLGELLRGALSAGLWTAYLLRSRRVQNTYYSHDAEAEAFE